LATGVRVLHESSAAACGPAKRLRLSADYA
jgi:hypothetical protein